MVTITFDKKFSASGNKQYEIVHDVRCLSTDTKPTTGISNGSTLLEIDTGDVYIFDGEGKTWNAM